MIRALVAGALLGQAARWAGAALKRSGQERAFHTGEAVDVAGNLIRIRVAPLTRAELDEARAHERAIADELLDE